MGMKLSKTYPNGVTGNYWELLTLEILVDQKAAEGTIACYVSKESKLAGSLPLNIERYRIPWTQMAFPSGVDLVDEAQKELKKPVYVTVADEEGQERQVQVNPWAGAEDDL